MGGFGPLCERTDMDNDTVCLTKDYGYGVFGKIIVDTQLDDTYAFENYLGKIVYFRRSKEVLGTYAVSEEEMQEIAEGIKEGTLIGMPVYAYVHSGVALSTVPFHCRWDSGQSGYVYTTRARAYEGWDLESDKKILEVLQQEVDYFNDCLAGNVHAYVIYKGKEVLDSCYGFVGDIEKSDIVVCMDMTAAAIINDIKEEEEEEEEAAYWAARDVVTK
jgi:hypothetical protein